MEYPLHIDLAERVPIVSSTALSLRN